MILTTQTAQIRHDVVYKLICSQLIEILRHHDEKIVYNYQKQSKTKCVKTVFQKIFIIRHG